MTSAPLHFFRPTETAGARHGLRASAGDIALGLARKMINRQSHPVGWHQMLTEIEDLREHLGSLIKELDANGGMDEEDFHVQLGHVYAHLNRIWHARNEGEGLKEEQWSEFSRFPKDLKLVG